eukprot:CAMPEP_0195264064 /NCGR_PEP_ID=MMETSP0706-20130129/10646_1 /TAXON_ID=33640 /ORGANISM="Asterionellopsis glacialis, Strain CCMP134" /LENGTH=228 /DNA_ID=CAMNT_0040318301 /DNA_START=18 /DNA_END=704 /DNA_ORIENTATION=-
MTKLLPWLPLASVPIALTYFHFANLDDPAFSPKYRQELIDSFSIPDDVRGGSTRLQTLLHIAFPYLTATFLYFMISKQRATELVKVQGVLKSTLQLHAAVFVFYNLAGELFPNVMAKLIGSPLFHADAITHLFMSALADMFFVGALLFWLMSIQDAVPRWVTWVPLVQSVYNVMNDFRWSFPDHVPGGVAVPYRMIVIDGGVFTSLLLSYVYAYVSAEIVEESVKKNK